MFKLYTYNFGTANLREFEFDKFYKSFDYLDSIRDACVRPDVIVLEGFDKQQTEKVRSIMWDPMIMKLENGEVTGEREFHVRIMQRLLDS